MDSGLIFAVGPRFAPSLGFFCASRRG